MTLLYFDCFAGICGSMVLGALVDAGLDPDDLRSDLARLPLEGYELRFEKVKRRGLAGTLVTVDHAETHVHRGLGAVLTIIDRSELPEAVRENGRRVFRALATAEAKVHASTVEKIHFHEVGAVDAIVDIMGTAAGLYRLGVERIVCSPINTGSGFVDCAHGRMPVPAPATAELLAGVPLFAEPGVEKELTTPTGAALAVSLASSFGPRPPMQVDRIGYGAGTHELPFPNLLRIFVGTPTDVGTPTEARRPGATEPAFASDTVVEVRTALDDMSPELIGYLFERLYAAGALEVYAAPIYMKKNRPGQELTLLAAPAGLDAVLAVLFRESTSLGARVQTVTRRILPREIVEVTTPLGAVRVKIARLDGQVVNTAPEYEDCRRLAETGGVPLKTIYEAARRAAGEIV